MNLLFYLAMSATGCLGALHELLYKRTNWTLLGVTILLFVVTMCSRIGYSPESSDFDIYIGFFQLSEETYFEPGYVFYTDVLRELLGKYDYVLVAGVALWLVGFTILAFWLCDRLDQPKDVARASGETFFPACMFFLISLYWGSFFGAETFRVGMATVILYSACALAIHNKTGWAFLVAALAVLFHYTAALFAVVILILAFVKDLNRKQYLYWFGVMLVLDVVLYRAQAFTASLVNQLFSMIEELEFLEHFTSYGKEEAQAYFTTQYLSYHLFALLMLLGDLSDSRYNKAVKIYYVGLGMGTLFQSVYAAMRIQWLFLAMIAFVLYYFVKDERYELRLKLPLLGAFAVLQQIMVLRVIGWHL